MLLRCFRKYPILLFSAVLVPAVVLASEPPVLPKKTGSIIRYDSIHSPVKARLGMVVSQRNLASEIGASILREGGNAVDAAVAVGFALAVLLPRAGNIGGGGFMLVYLAKEDKTITIDYRETAPQAAYRDMFLDADGEVNRELYRSGVKSAGVPGTVAGLSHALKKYGSMTLSQVMQPAIELAELGFDMDYDTASAIAVREKMLKKHDATSKVFFRADGSAYSAGERFLQPDLAGTLKEIAKAGPQGFYSGVVADKIIAQMDQSGGVITREDLAKYAPIERTPIVGKYRGYTIVSMPPPSSGGVHIVQMLNILENFDLRSMGAQSADALHVVGESMRYAYADRSKHLGDPDFYQVPINWLTDKAYAKQIADSIQMDKAGVSSEILPGVAPPYESVDTTHFSVADKDGNAVSNTYTLNFSFGSGVVVEGAGFLLNNEMTDFNAKSGVADAFGLLGGEANSIQPNKRPLSAMTPTLVFKDDALYMVTGSPGGSRIINAVLQQIVNVIDHDMNIASATHSPRIHHQWQPDQLQLESSINPDTKRVLAERGHKLVDSGTMGSLQSILIEQDQLHGASDPRRPGAGVAGVD